MKIYYVYFGSHILQTPCRPQVSYSAYPDLWCHHVVGRGNSRRRGKVQESKLLGQDIILGRCQSLEMLTIRRWGSLREVLGYELP